MATRRLSAAALGLAGAFVMAVGARVGAGLGPVTLLDRHGQPFAVLWNEEVRAEDRCDRGMAYLVRGFLRADEGQEAAEELQLPAGTRVETTLDLQLQRLAQEALHQGLGPGVPDGRGIPQPQGALVAMDPRTGDVLALVPGRCTDSLNRAVAAFRQAGSTLKPFIYALALQAGDTPATLVEDAPLEIRLPDGTVWAPRNAAGPFQGRVTLRDALVHSLNAASVRVLQRVGIDRALELLGRLGFSRLDPTVDRALGLVLGGVAGGVSPMELARAYSVFPSRGYLPEVRTVRRVLGPDGEVWQEVGLRRRPVLDPVTAYQVTAMLQDVLTVGTAAGQGDAGVPAAGKTGTGEGDTDAWFVGFTPQLVVAVWIGADEPRPLETGGAPYASLRAVRVWVEFMKKVQPAPQAFDPPRGVVTARIDVKTGKRVPADCVLAAGEVRMEVFRADTVPQEVSPRCAASSETGG